MRSVLFAAEGKAFSAGGDLNEVLSLQADSAKRSRMCDTGQRIIHALIDIPVPIVVALNKIDLPGINLDRVVQHLREGAKIFKLRRKVRSSDKATVGFADGYAGAAIHTLEGHCYALLMHGQNLT